VSLHATPEASVVAAIDGVVADAEGVADGVVADAEGVAVDGGVAEGVATLFFGVDEHAERVATSRTTKPK